MFQNKIINSPECVNLASNGLGSKLHMTGFIFGIVKENKKCSRCGVVKSTNDFNVNKKEKGGLSYHCKVCDFIRIQTYRRTKSGLISRIYQGQVSSSKLRNHPLPTYSKQEFTEFALASPKFHKLYEGWVNSGYLNSMSPSFDRANDYLPYSFENFNDWMPWGDNRKKGYLDKINGINNKVSKAIIGVHKITDKKIEFYSAAEAERQLNISRKHISACCLCKRKSAGGYIWEHKNKTER